MNTSVSTNGAKDQNFMQFLAKKINLQELKNYSNLTTIYMFERRIRSFRKTTLSLISVFKCRTKKETKNGVYVCVCENKQLPFALFFLTQRKKEDGRESKEKKRDDGGVC